MTDLVVRVTRRLRPRAVTDEAALEADLMLAAAYDAERGYDRPRNEQSKLAYEMAENAPLVRWVPPSLRPHRR